MSKTQPESEDYLLIEAKKEDLSSIPESIQAIFDAHIPDDSSWYDDAYWYRWTKRSLLEFDIENALFNAIPTNDILLVKEIIKHYSAYKQLWIGADIRLAVTGNFEMVKMLLDNGFVCNEEFAKGWHGGLRTWWERGWNGWSSAFYTQLSEFSYRSDDPAIIQLLIDRGARVNKRSTGMGPNDRTYSAVFRAAEAGKADNLRVLINADGNVNLRGFWYRETPLIAAAKSGNDECVKILIEAGADMKAVDDYGTTVLIAAAASGNERSVRLLLEAGAGKTINATNNWGSTALIEAAIAGSGETVKALIAAGADINAGTWEGGSYAYTQWYLYSEGLTALMLASTGDVVKTLLTGGADVNAVDNDGHNAIYYQCFFYRNAETIEALIKAGSYLYLNVNGGRDLLRLSKSWSDWEQNNEIIAMLEQAGCVDDDPDGEWDHYSDYFHVDRH
jgi:ankyrin repeat protein